MQVRPTPVTVLMPVRNACLQIGNAIRDLSAGLQDQDELLVVDDGSEDGTAQVLSEFAKRDARIRLVNTSGVGLVRALNLGLVEATHDWIARADADDRYPRDRLVRQREARQEDTVLVTGDYGIAVDDRKLGVIPCALGHPFVVASLVNPQRIPHPGVMYLRPAVMEAGGYQAAEFPAEDVGLWLRLARVGNFVGVPHEVVRWTMSLGSITHQRQAEQRERTKSIVGLLGSVAALQLINADSIRKESRSYSRVRCGMERRVLMSRDLSRLARMGVIPRYTSHWHEFVQHPLAAVVAVSRLQMGRASRQRARRGFQQTQAGWGPVEA